MTTFVRSSLMPVPAARLAQWHFRTGAIDRLLPPWERVEVLERPGAMADGAIARFRVKKFGAWVEWVARHHDVQPGRSFCDTQVSGPFASWDHRHSFLPKDEHSSMLEDRVEYRLPGGSIGSALGGGMVASDLERMFRWRHARTRHDLSHHGAFPDECLHVAVSGASGLVGSALVPFLTTGGASCAAGPITHAATWRGMREQGHSTPRRSRDLMRWCTWPVPASPMPDGRRSASGKSWTAGCDRRMHSRAPWPGWRGARR
jgi:ligand-binding SRPBCC domain-containing protein